MNNQKIGELISKLRKEKNMTQKELAQKLNITDKAVSKWERGMGYPDITTVPALAKLLGVSISELLLGERMEDENNKNQDLPDDIKKTDAIVTDVMEYAEKTHHQRVARANCVAFTVISIIFLIAIFVCVLCNVIISGKLDWSLYVVGSEVVTWIFIAPLLLKKKHGLILSLILFTILILPFLQLIDYLVPKHNLVFPFAFPIVAISIVSIWLCVLLFTYTRIKRLYLISLSFIVIGVIDNLLLNNFVQSYFNHLSNENISVPITALSFGFIAIILFIIALRKNSKPNDISE